LFPGIEPGLAQALPEFQADCPAEAQSNPEKLFAATLTLRRV